MNGMALREATRFFRSYGVNCDEKLVGEWLKTTSTSKDLMDKVSEDNLYAFNEWLRWKGTAYEEGISNQTKIARLLEEISELKNERTLLQTEKKQLQDRLGIVPF